jgi:hypothetical protein
MTAAYQADSESKHVENKEGEDLPVPLPKWSKSDLKEVHLYGSLISPPCVKVRAVLKFWNVPFEEKSGKPQNSIYQGMPILVVNGRQINDSFIILKTLCPILTGREMTPAEVELEQMITFGIMPRLEADVAASCCDLCKCAGLMGCPTCLLLRCFSCCIPCCGPSMITGQYPGLKSQNFYSSELKRLLGSEQYFNGSEPGISDVSLFGLLAGFSESGTDAFSAFFDDDSLRSWHGRMKGKAPKFPFY